jgi:hypothetical protein
MHNIKTLQYKNVSRLYPNATILGINEMLTKNNGWQPTPSILNNQYNDFNMVLEHLKSIEVESIQLVIKNQYNLIVYPDYKINELIS